MRPLRGFGILVLTIVLASAWGCGSTATKEGTGEYVDDSVITTKVKTDIDKAVQVASGVAGVKSVKNDMRLK